MICKLGNLDDDEAGETPLSGRYQDPVFYHEVTIIVLSNHAPGYHYQEEWAKGGMVH